MDSLRAEISASQNVRSDLMKWKLLVIAALGTAGLGLGNLKFPDAHMVLCLIPPVAVYVDALCAHLSLRIKVIGEFIISLPLDRGDHLRDYEHFIRLEPPKFKLETIALHWSTIFVSTLVILYGYSDFPSSMLIKLPLFGDCSGAILFYTSGILGIILTVGVLLFVKRRSRVISKCAQKIIDDSRKSSVEAS